MMPMTPRSALCGSGSTPSPSRIFRSACSAGSPEPTMARHRSGTPTGSATSYLDFANRGKEDTTSFGSPPASKILEVDFDSEVLSQEVYLNSKADGPWRWTVGGMARRAEERLFVYRTSYLAPTDQADLS